MKQALVELDKLFEECQKIIDVNKIELDQTIDNPEIVNHLAQIKMVMAGKDISPEYLPENQYDLLKNLLENPRFRQVCELEFKLYCMLRQFQKPLGGQREEIQEKFNETLELLRKSLVQVNLPESFVLPEIQHYLFLPKAKLALDVEVGVIGDKPDSLLGNKESVSGEKKEASSQFIEKSSSSNSSAIQAKVKELKEKCRSALYYYMGHREETIGWFAFIFDYFRGFDRALHYDYLIQSAKTEREVYLIEYAILVNSDGTQLKMDWASQLGFKDENTAKESLKKLIQNCFDKEDLPELDKLIESVNLKANHEEYTKNEVFNEELTYLTRLRTPSSPLEHHSFFSTKKESLMTGFWHWIVNTWLGYDYYSPEKNKLSLN